MVSLAQRLVVDELMDAPSLEAGAHARALAGLRRINWSSRAAGQMAGPMWRMARSRGMKELSILDVACGGGDVPMRVAEILARRGVRARLTLVDKSKTALAMARAAAERAGVEADVVEGCAPNGLPGGAFDVVSNSLFLHHLGEEEVVETLRAMAERARHLVVISDLRRSWAGYALAQVACRMLSRSPIVHFDGPASVRAAYTVEEMRELARRAGLSAEIRQVFPIRMMLTVEKGAEIAVEDLAGREMVHGAR